MCREFVCTTWTSSIEVMISAFKIFIKTLKFLGIPKMRNPAEEPGTFGCEFFFSKKFRNGILKKRIFFSNLISFISLDYLKKYSVKIFIRTFLDVSRHLEKKKFLITRDIRRFSYSKKSTWYAKNVIFRYITIT